MVYSNSNLFSNFYYNYRNKEHIFI